MVKALPHMEHLKGLSPVCVLMWISSAEPEQKFLAHTLHTCRLTGSICPLADPADPAADSRAEGAAGGGGGGAGGESEAGAARGEEGGRPARARPLVRLG